MKILVKFYLLIFVHYYHIINNNIFIYTNYLVIILKDIRENVNALEIFLGLLYAGKSVHTGKGTYKMRLANETTRNYLSKSNYLKLCSENTNEIPFCYLLK